MSEERVEAYAKLLNTLISAVRQEERALSRETEAERDALREQVKMLREQKRRMHHALVVCRDYAQGAERWRGDLEAILRDNADDLPTLAEVSAMLAAPEQEG